MGTDLTEQLQTLFFMFLGTVLFALVIALWKDNKVFAVIRVVLSVFVMILAVLSGTQYPFIWTFLTALTFVSLAIKSDK